MIFLDRSALDHVKFARVIAVHRIVPPVYEEISEGRVTSTGYRVEWQSFRASVLRGEQPAPPEGWRPLWARLVEKIRRALASSEAHEAVAQLVYESGLERLDGPLVAPPADPDEEAQGLFACAIADRPSHGPVEALRKLIWA
ncbi:MAG: hypothetical protein E6G97_18315 [Alphaproteobacteria bacterium]|nr:MAG: hypothetical protein E6G97_18315 [Alphaproteobacteria bacterium]